MLTAMRLLTVMLALWSSLAGAADLVVHIEQYRHIGCQVGNQRHLPASAGGGAVVRHVYPGGKKQCMKMITYAQQGCRMATIYSTTNDGAPWQPGERDMGCLPVFSAEVSRCVAHYKMEGVKCGSAPASEAGGSAAQPAQPRASVFEGRWLVTDKNVYGYTNTFVCTISVSGTRFAVPSCGSRLTILITSEMHVAVLENFSGRSAGHGRLRRTD